jgi:hypothetical protein
MTSHAPPTDLPPIVSPRIMRLSPVLTRPAFLYQTKLEILAFNSPIHLI